jgi:hypothetical protein
MDVAAPVCEHGDWHLLYNSEARGDFYPYLVLAHLPEPPDDVKRFFSGKRIFP